MKRLQLKTIKHKLKSPINSNDPFIYALINSHFLSYNDPNKGLKILLEVADKLYTPLPRMEWLSLNKHLPPNENIEIVVQSIWGKYVNVSYVLLQHILYNRYLQKGNYINETHFLIIDNPGEN